VHEHIGAPKHSSHVAQHFPAKQKRPDAKSPATSNLPTRFKSPTLVCSIAPALIGAAILPADGVKAGPFHAKMTKYNPNDATSAILPIAKNFRKWIIIF
jgi:hypothetical protein